ncbi:hypothetical protein B0H15DRAFT_793326 [Mycena belliarum]|uniref:CxC1-like cysteine cluster associated with KDZ transposases domain-containing protein n=1 Tax=Mycena belliarum TaxID=1033014 RepID=A0AAD6TS85_9AGAR|nr:hypothetical protein B0H15DRAFT_793326 [Mycena belliae]
MANLLIILPDTTDVGVKLKPAGGIAAALVLEGLMPCAPWSPAVAFKMRVLEMYRVTHVRCPQLAVQSFVKSLCDMHGVAYRPYLCQQFSIAYDLYLDIRRKTDERVMKVLGRDSTWRLKHTCPACMYKLEGEDELIFNMLTTMDGNNSLKRVLRREKRTMADDEADEPTLANSSERVDGRDAGDGYFISREKVETWAKTRLAQLLPMEAEDSTEDNPCAERWKNMIHDVTSRMWGIFDETGIFLALCRHGFVLVIADMIRSGELAKYPLAVVDELLQAFGMKLGAGYDVGCHFQATVNNSELGARARAQKLRCLVGSFHGHAHNRLCQLGFLATYVEGMGLEDLEGCERFFSRSNGLARSCRYASRFHRQQEIATYAKHFDSVETYANLSKFLCSNYRQALTILKSEATLKTWMRQEGIESFEEFKGWLEEEKTYLLGLKNTAGTNQETLEMEYVQKLINLSLSQYVMPSLIPHDLSHIRAKYKVLSAEARQARGDDGTYAPGVGKAEIARRHGKDKLDRDFQAVEDLEVQLDVLERWTAASPQWQSTVAQIKKRKFQLALGALELLIVERIFELTKTNQSQTGSSFVGYKMRKHIAKALQARSKAVRRAIDNYNAAARALDPPMPVLGWEQVVEYAFLADFDILRDTNAEIQARPWTRPAYRLAMDRYFRILRAREEIKRLNVEIPRVVTWIADENRVLRKAERALRQTEGKSDKEIETDIGMAVQLELYRERRGRFDDSHMRRFWALAKAPGFTGSVKPGVSVEQLAVRRALLEARAALARMENEMDIDEEVVVDGARSAWQRDEVDGWEDVDNPTEDSAEPHGQVSDDEGEGDEAKEQEVSGLMYHISMLAVDGGGRWEEGRDVTHYIFAYLPWFLCISIFFLKFPFWDGHARPEALDYIMCFMKIPVSHFD